MSFGEVNPELIPGLPEELALECLTRLHHTTHRHAAGVCRRWRELLQSKDFYHQRKQNGHTRLTACLVQSVQDASSPDWCKPVGPPNYRITIFDPVSGSWSRVGPVPKCPNGLPLFCQVTSSEGKLIVIGGWDSTTFRPVRDVFVYDFMVQRWRKGKDMPETRSFFAIGQLCGRVIVAGGHDHQKNALRTAWAYDVVQDEWTELSPMSQERDECEGVVVGSEFWAVSGYKTVSQGGFEGSAEVLNLGSGQWRRVEDAWKVGQCPRLRVKVGREGNLSNWAGYGPEAQGGMCAVQLDEWAFVSQSAYQGRPHGFFMLKEQSGKLEKRDVHVPVEFSGFVQYGCVLEI
ncbi:hypothetical protein SLEP1_g49348 [Rubroshorea leprosula]|uniref:F-box domain-containing protein n=1 Tax=Rubroshorea leprosula TaxID=152421 RepID=A0AAV5LZJ7_9ROSI|nr:hypothetical protein SLEP1_g49348 [Rubroshorea leprosula]